MKNYLTIGGGLAIIISMFLPFALDINLMAMGGVAYFYIGCGAIIAVVGFVGKKMLNILSLILGLTVLGLGIKYVMDYKDLGVPVGIGLWVMLAGGALAAIGSLMGLMKKAE